MRWTVAICALIGLTAVQDTSPQIHKQGKIQFYDRAAVDIDEGSAIVEVHVDGDDSVPDPTHPSVKGSDFWFEVGHFLHFHPEHGAMFSASSVSSPEYSACAKASYKKGSIRVDNVGSREHLCVRTSEGRYANILITNYDPKSRQLSLSYTTWEKQTPSGTGNPRH